MTVWQRLVTLAVCVDLIALPAAAADLEPRTVAAFDRYVAVTEAQTAAAQQFLAVDALVDGERRAALARLRRGELVIARPQTTQDGTPIGIPSGLVHHWRGTAFIPDATVAQAVALLQDYDRHAEIYRPNVARSHTLSKDGDVYRVYLRFFMKKGITVVVNSEHEARFSSPAGIGHRAGFTACGSPKWRTRTRRVSGSCRSAATAGTCGGSIPIGASWSGTAGPTFNARRSR